MCYSTTQLMSLKFNLNKIAKIYDWENFPIAEANKLWNLYTEYLEKHEGKDIIDNPNIDLSFD